MLVGLVLLLSGHPAAADLVCPFAGKIDFGEKKFDFKMDLGNKSSISFEGTTLSKDNYNLLVNIDHLKTPLFDLSTEFETLIAVVNKGKTLEETLQGQIKSRYSLINYKPFEEVSGFFEMRNKTLYVDSLSLGGVNLSGYIELFSPYKIDLSVLLKEIKMGDFLAFWGAQEDLASHGLVSGQIFVYGVLDQLGLKGNLASYNGFVDQLEFDSIVLNVDGIYPIVRLDNSRVSQTDGMTFNLEGDLDLTQKEKFESEIAALKKLPVVSSDESSLEWTIHRRESSPTSSATEFKYFLRKESLNMGPMKDGPDLLGVERSIKF